jgi:nitroreductase
MQYFKYIPLRRSIRRFNNDPVPDELLEKALNQSKNFIKLVETQEIRFVPVVGNEKFQKTFKQALGDYGKLLNAPLYIGVATNNHYKDKNANAGFIGEQLVIELTALGLATCWNASDDNDMFKNLFELKEGEALIGFISVGYPAKDLQGKLINKMLGKTSGKRKKLKNIVFKDNEKTKAKKSEIVDMGLHDIFEMARLAPSWHNVQPWHFIIEENNVYLIFDFQEKRYKQKAINKRKYFHFIDMGIIMSHFSMALKETGTKGNWHILSKNEAKKAVNRLNINDKKGIPFARLELERK